MAVGRRDQLLDLQEIDSFLDPALHLPKKLHLPKNLLLTKNAPGASADSLWCCVIRVRWVSAAKRDRVASGAREGFTHGSFAADCSLSFHTLRHCIVITLAFTPMKFSSADGGVTLVSGSRLVIGEPGERSASVRIGDLDGDDDLDLVFANGRHWPQQNYVCLNQGRARFNVLRPLGRDRSTSYATELADLDGDGDLDVAVGNDMAPCRVFFNDGSGHFAKSVAFGVVSSVRSLTLADVDADGDIDVLATCRGQPNRIYFNDGQGGFKRDQIFGDPDDSTLDVAVADVNGDSHLDLVLANRDGQPNVVLLNDGHAVFGRRVPFGAGDDQTRAVVVGDFDGDGISDLAIGNIGRSNAICFGSVDSVFDRTVAFGRRDGRTYSVGAADFDRDGDLDLVVGNVGQPNAVFINDGSGSTFEECRFGQEVGASYGLAIGDVDGDRFLDVVIANSGSQNQIYLNRSQQQRAQAR